MASSVKKIFKFKKYLKILIKFNELLINIRIILI